MDLSESDSSSNSDGESTNGDSLNISGKLPYDKRLVMVEYPGMWF